MAEVVCIKRHVMQPLVPSAWMLVAMRVSMCEATRMHGSFTSSAWAAVPLVTYKPRSAACMSPSAAAGTQ